MEDFDRCIKVAGDPTIYMVREDQERKVAIEKWEEYVELGKPGFVVVSQEEADEYKTIAFFRPKFRADFQEAEDAGCRTNR